MSPPLPTVGLRLGPWCGTRMPSGGAARWRGDEQAGCVGGQSGEIGGAGTGICGVGPANGPVDGYLAQ